MTLGELLRLMPRAQLHGEDSTSVQGISHDSRKIKPGWIFAACPGNHCHGLQFAAQALGNGACALLTDQEPDDRASVPWITTPEPRADMAVAALAVAGRPQDRLMMIGVTGTNGKSTTTDLIYHVLEAGGSATGLFGTLGYHLPGEVIEAQRTTPEATDLAPLLARLVELGGSAAVMECSSHALIQDRLEGLRFQVAVWTNLTRDHLDYHGDMEAYFAAKKRLFVDHLETDGRRVLPVDDPWGSRLLNDPQPGDVSWGPTQGMVRAETPRLSLKGTEFNLCLPDARFPVRLRLLGAHNLRNALAAAAAAYAAGSPAEAIRLGLETARPLPGRLEEVGHDLGFPVLVDYAHTPDGLSSMLGSLRELTQRRLIVVFGAGGDRDRGKRAPMGKAVGTHADVPIVTTDNPRSEDPEVIAAAVADGVRAGGADPVVVLDRRAAITTAIELADANSLVVIAGKGHEQLQLIGEQRIPFSDRAIVSELAEAKA